MPRSSTLATPLARIRVLSGLTQTQLADKLGIAHATMNNLERGKVLPSAKLASKIQDILGCEIEIRPEGGVAIVARSVLRHAPYTSRSYAAWKKHRLQESVERNSLHRSLPGLVKQLRKESVVMHPHRREMIEQAAAALLALQAEVNELRAKLVAVR